MRLALGFVLALALAGPCLAGIEVVVPAPVQVTPLDPGAKPQPVSLTRMAANIPAGQPWARSGPVAFFIPIDDALRALAVKPAA